MDPLQHKPAHHIGDPARVLIPRNLALAGHIEGFDEQTGAAFIRVSPLIVANFRPGTPRVPEHWIGTDHIEHDEDDNDE